MKTITDRVEKLIAEYPCITDMDDAYDALWFAAHVLDDQADILETEEPYAINTIRRYREAARDLQGFACRI